MQMSLYLPSLFNFKGQQYSPNVRSRPIIRPQEKWLIRTYTSGIQLVLTHIILLNNESQISQHDISISKNTENFYSKW